MVGDIIIATLAGALAFFIVAAGVALLIGVLKK